MKGNMNKRGKLKINYGYGSERFDTGHPVEIVGEDGDDYLVKPFPIMSDKNKPLRIKKMTLT